MFKAEIKTQKAMPDGTIITETSNTKIRSTEFPRANEVEGESSSGLKAIKLIYDDTINKIKDQNNEVLTFDDIYTLTTGNNLVTVNYSDVIYRLVFFDGVAIEFSNSYLYGGTEWFGRIIINNDNQVKFNEIPGDVYSTDEVIVGKWIDGRDVYRKTYRNFSDPNKLLDSNRNQNNTIIVNAFGQIKYQSGNTLSFPDMYSSVVLSDNDMRMYSREYLSADTENNYVTVDYVKITG